MFNFFVIVSLSLLTGCTTISEYYSNKYAVNSFDSNHYQIISEIRFLAHNNQSYCDNDGISSKNAFEMSNKTYFFKLYTDNLPNELEMRAAAIQLNSMSLGLSDQYKYYKTEPHIEFCRIKFQNIETAATNIQKILGARPR
jgi:hypothetical protein